MTCRSVMTKDPSCCLPGDSVSAAARIMRQQDVGPVLVVSDHSNMRLIGIVTDRDIALEVVADGRDPYTTRVDSIMTANPVTVGPDDDLDDAVKLMAEYQVRRVPVVDSNSCVVGIIAQADLALQAEDDQVGDLVEEISQPFGSGEWSGGNLRLRRKSAASTGMDAVSALAIGALCVGFGAGLMYMFDPSRGRKRRAQLMEKGHELWDQRSDVMNRAQSMYETARQKVTGSGSGSQQQPQQGMQGGQPSTSSMTGMHRTGSGISPAVEPMPLPR